MGQVLAMTAGSTAILLGIMIVQIKRGRAKLDGRSVGLGIAAWLAFGLVIAFASRG